MCLVLIDGEGGGGDDGAAAAWEAAALLTVCFARLSSVQPAPRLSLLCLYHAKAQDMIGARPSEDMESWHVPYCTSAATSATNDERFTSNAYFASVHALLSL